MKNKLSMNVDVVAGKLIKAGVAIKKIYHTTEPDVEDDAIYVTDTVHVQVSSYGDPYMTVSRQHGEEFVNSSPRLSIADIVSDINKAMKE